MLTKEQQTLIREWLKMNEVPADRLLMFAECNEGWLIHVVDSDDKDNIPLALGFVGELPKNIDANRAYTQYELGFLGNIRDGKTKMLFLSYLKANPDQRFFQTVINFARTHLKLSCHSLYMKKTPNDTTTLDMFYIEADNYLKRKE